MKSSINPAALARPLRLQIDNFTDNMWGGDWIPRLKGVKHARGPVGEAWEFSAHPSRPSRVEAPGLDPVRLADLLSSASDAILGERAAKRLAGQPPFLLKLIDSRDDLSVQVHPADAYAREMERDSGKAESWVILDVDASAGGGFIYLGFDRRHSDGFSNDEAFAEAFLGAISQANAQGPSTDPRIRAKAERLVLPFLNRISVKRGDTYHIPPGTIHAIGRGVRLFEIQQSSDVTYRVWDWNRPDPKKLASGQMAFRSLHVDKARDVLDFRARTGESYRVETVRLPADGTGQTERRLLIEEPSGLYGAERWTLESGARVQLPRAFGVLTVVSGSGSVDLSFGENSPLVVASGESILIPACTPRIHMSAPSGPCDVLRSYLPD